MATTTSREHVSRIDRSYFHRENPFQKQRRWLVLAALAVGVAWCAWGAIDVPRHHSPGPVAAVHAKWEADCEACHVPLSPITDNTWLTTASTRKQVQAKCEACHRAADHHPLQMTAEVGSCASCHADHRGRSADLSRVSDMTCVACHGNITAHRVALSGVKASEVRDPITRFDESHHPPFASLASDPGRLKFSHGRHMRAGLTFGPIEDGKGGGGTRRSDTSPATRATASVWTYAMLEERDRSRYQPPTSREHDAIQLSCASCHEFATSLPPGDIRQVSSLQAVSPPGAYSLPVEFERHCAACHVLPFEGTSPGAPSTVASTEKGSWMPHGLDAEAMRRFLETAFLARAVRDGRPPLETPAAAAPLPQGPDEAERDGRLRAAIRREVESARNFAMGTCEKCHEVEPKSLSAATSLLAAATSLLAAATTEPAVAGEEPWFRVPPTRVPDIWLTKAKFNHQPHRAYDCRQCHAAAYPDDAVGPPVGSPLDNVTVMIAGRDSCVQCHSPSRYDASTRAWIGGARFDCVECHGYHGLGPHGTKHPAFERAAAAR